MCGEKAIEHFAQNVIINTKKTILAEIFHHVIDFYIINRWFNIFLWLSKMSSRSFF